MKKLQQQKPTRVRFSILASIFVILIGALGVLGALSYIFLVGKVERVEVKAMKK